MARAKFRTRPGLRRYFPDTLGYGKMTGRWSGPWIAGCPSPAMLHANPSQLDAATIRARLHELWERTGIAPLGELAEHRPPRPDARMETEQDYLDWVSTCLMDAFKDTGDAAVFGLLFELNRGSFLQAIQSSLRRAYHHVDPQDVLQEVFLNIYRYPHRFHADKADAFRGWGHRIARNTLLKFLKGQMRLSRFLEMDEESLQPEDVRTRRPDRAASDAETAAVVDHAYLLYLQLYLLHFRRLSGKEQLALTMVEVDGVSYRDAAAHLEIRLENLKMVIFRARRKIFRGMETSLATFAGSSASAAAAPAPSSQAPAPHRIPSPPGDPDIRRFFDGTPASNS
jgi:RNA polymerase sigma-70 factor (ECF subfamily)